MFTQAEQELLEDASIFYHKASITQKVIQLLNQAKSQIQLTSVHSNFPYPENMDTQLGKISKGENYQGLPYLMLDFPRLFKSNEIFAFRTFFWWGNYCLSILHLSGAQLDLYRSKLVLQYEYLKQIPIYISAENEEWHHALDDNHYKLVSDLTHEEYTNLIENQLFIKLVQKMSLSQLEYLPNFVEQSYTNAFKVLL